MAENVSFFSLLFFCIAILVAPNVAEATFLRNPRAWVVYSNPKKEKLEEFNSPGVGDLNFRGMATLV